MSPIALKIQTTGIEQYAPGGEAVLKTMFIGGPGAGKTRLSSYWPKPLYADCEGGLSSIADRKMPFVTINSSQDMLDLLAYLKMECRRPIRDRQYQTVVIDTLDAFQRKVKDEWLQANPGSQSFRGFDAWGYLDAKMQMLLTRLLNLDMNVIVNVHYKDKTIREGSGENATERQELTLQLSGEVKDSVFNDFDLVGWLGRYYEAVDGQRVEKRGLTFKSTPEKPFLKDRLHVTPTWMEVTFSDEDYARLFGAFIERLDDLQPGEQVGEIPSSGPEGSIPTGGIVAPDSGTGPLPGVSPREVPLKDYDKPTLQKLARELGVRFAQNTIKAELIAMVEAARAEQAASAKAEPTSTSDAGEASPAPATEAAPGSSGLPAEALAARKAAAQSSSSEPASAVRAAATPVPSPPTAAPGAPTAVAEVEKSSEQGGSDSVNDISTEMGDVDKTTGEFKPMTTEKVVEALGGQVISEQITPETNQVPPASQQAPVAPSAPAAPATSTGRPAECELCGKALAGENQDYIKLGWIKFRKYLCNEDYLARRKTA